MVANSGDHRCLFGEEKAMTKNAKLGAAATVALFISLATMILFHAYGPRASLMHAGFQGTHPMTAMWTEMGWLMALGPIAMILFFGGILTLVVLLVRYLVRSN
jgi:hypothetical protein